MTTLSPTLGFSFSIPKMSIFADSLAEETVYVGAIHFLPLLATFCRRSSLFVFVFVFVLNVFDVLYLFPTILETLLDHISLSDFPCR
jgi:hypothetical protein